MNNSPPKVSVVMPVLNGTPQYFTQAVQSLQRQTLTQWQLLVVEDPSDRSLKDTALAFGDPRIQFVTNQSRTSLVAQRNQGLALSESDIVAMLDSDDICEPTRLADQFDFLAANPGYGVVGSQLTIIDDTGRAVASRAYPVDHDQIKDLMRFRCSIAQPAAMFRKRLVLDSGGYANDQYHGTEDYELWSRLLTTTNTEFANLPAPLLRYRVHSQQIKTTSLSSQLRGTLAIKRKYWRDSMGFTAKIRMAAESVLLWLPATFVLWLFTALHHKPRVSTE